MWTERCDVIAPAGVAPRNTLSVIRNEKRGIRATLIGKALSVRIRPQSIGVAVPPGAPDHGGRGGESLAGLASEPGSFQR